MAKALAVKRQHPPRMTRRQVLRGAVAASALLGGMWWLGRMQPLGPEDQLRRALDALPLPHSPARLALVKFDDQGPDVTILVRLTWQPGQRQQKFVTPNRSAEQSVDDLVDDVRAWVDRLV